MTTPTNVVRHVVENEDWVDGLGWDVDPANLAEIHELLVRKAYEVRRTIESYNASCVYDADAPEDRVPGFDTMPSAEYGRLFYGPDAPGRAF